MKYNEDTGKYEETWGEVFEVWWFMFLCLGLPVLVAGAVGLFVLQVIANQ